MKPINNSGLRDLWPFKAKIVKMSRIIHCSLIPKYHVNIARSYFKATSPDIINSSLSVWYQDLETSVKP